MRAPGVRAGSARPIAFICLGLAIITFAIYWPVFGNQFVNYDDSNYITENPHVQNGLNWTDFKWAFTTGYTGYAHPVTWLTHQLDYQLYGGWAGGHHLTNLVIHILNSILLFLLFWRITRNLWPSAFVAALFAIHPLHVESVAWAAERKDVLSALFFMLMLHAYAIYASKRLAWTYFVALCCFVLGILSKPMLVTGPAVLLLFDYWPLRRLTFELGGNDSARSLSIKRLIFEKIPFVLVAAGWSILTFILQKEAGVVGQQAITLRIANAFVSYAVYFLNALWPHDLAVLYPYPAILPIWQVIVSVALLLLVSVVCVVRRKDSPHLIAGWLWYLGMLVPVIGVIQVGAQARADRYTYLPQIGLWFALSWEIAALTRGWSLRQRLLPIAATCIVAVLSACTWNQTKIWRDSESLWKHALAVTSDNFVAHYNLGHVLGKQGRFDEAIFHFTEVLRSNPEFFDALLNIGVTLVEQGKSGEAIPYYQRALEVEPTSGKAHMQLALALVNQGQADSALLEFRKALELAPNDSDVRTNLGLMLVRQGQLSEATSQLEEAVRLNPSNAQAHNNLGLALLMAKQPEKSLPHFTEALRLKPDLAVAQENLRRAQKQIDVKPK